MRSVCFFTKKFLIAKNINIMHLMHCNLFTVILLITVKTLIKIKLHGHKCYL